ncbi:FtsK/SpoIIIE domain-containing protein [Myceligenerans xiligouense]|uniref:FtsK/SpoIIIE family protein n=1 Tax=Myceligenerans xiligouense TaxID=253184 RepID=A0A3N4YG14_9MICO|nr:FtsK/SpoIIIE domain-containing protein [Myceligenerans xiligouense]RPF20079.1 FtsK/SpoIIIE family protein [Myceligenerans xiligouense]
MTVRVTVHPGEDVELSDGVPTATFRDPLAALLCRPELRRAALLADGAPVPEDCRAGERPLLPGATLTTRRQGAAPIPDDGPLLRARWVLARTTGSRAGVLVPVGGPRDLVRATRRLTEAAAHGGWRGTALRLRRGGARGVLGPPRGSSDVAWVLSLLPVLTSVAVAVLLRQPALALFALVGLAGLLPHVLRRRTTGAGTLGAPPARTRPHRGGPDSLLAFAVAAHQTAPGTWRAARAAWSKAPVPPGWPGGVWDDLLGDGSVAVTGADGPARAVARAVVADLAARGRPVRVLGATRHWTWCRWLTTPGPGPGTPGHGPAGSGHDPTTPVHDTTLPEGAADATTAPAVVVDHGTPDDHAAARRAVAQGAVAVVLGTTDGCRTVVTVQDGRLHVTGPETRRRVRPLVGVTTEWAEHYARRLAGARHLGRTLATLTGTAAPATVTTANLPDDVPLGSLHDLDGLSAGPTNPRSGSWAVPLGRTTTGTVTWDLVTDGPHLLVAGTTGSGKSELLRALVLGLALQHPPGRLMLGLIDFKGGAGLGPLTGLPHVAGQVTDLDAALAARALAGLQAELRRRKTILAEQGAADVAALAPGTVPRLVVVVDEFRALADDLPELIPGLIRIAAQGRSLGVHLVLATQRPAGAVSADVRANVTARLALRVTDPLESRDVVDCPDAAALPVDRPGRAVLRIGSAAPAVLQCAHTGPVRPAMPVRRATPFGRTRGARAGTVLGVPSAPGRHRAGTGPEEPAGLVATIRAAYGASASHPPLWLPPLPDRVTPAELADQDDRDAPGLLLALGDLPDQQRRTVVRWDPDDGNLAVLGRTRSGRTTALAALAAAARVLGMTVRTVTPASATAPEHGDDLLLVDDLEAVRAAHPGWVPPPGVAVAVATRSPAAAYACGTGPRLVMLSRDRADDVALGAPAALAGSGGVPGRAAWCGRTGTVLCQVVLPQVVLPPAIT